MITELTLENFKSWKLIDKMRFAPITGLFGPNSSGKTSILQFLLMLKQTVESSDRSQPLDFGDERSIVDLGIFVNVLHDRNQSNPIHWQLKWNLAESIKFSTSDSVGNPVTFNSDGLTQSATVVSDDGEPVLSNLNYDFDSFHVKAHFVPEGEVGFQMTIASPSTINLAANPHFPQWKHSTPVKCYGFPEFLFSYYTNAGFLALFQNEFERLFDQVYYLGPLREYPKRVYLWGGSTPTDVGRRGEYVVNAILANRERGRIERGDGLQASSLEESVALCLHTLKLIDSFEVTAIGGGGSLYQVLVRKHKDSKQVLLTDVGFGVSQILPVVALCYYVPKGATIIFEQPEIHLHPSAQSALADIFIDAIKTRNIQIIIESHSEHLLRRLQRRIAEEKFDSKDAALYFCEFKKTESHLTPLELDEFGNIKNWPDDFFGDEFGEMLAITDAIIARQRNTTR